MSKVIRATGTNVTASDDAYIINKLFEDGLFSIPNLTISGNKLHITSFRGIVAGRDFQVDEQDVSASMGTGRNAAQFKIFVDINLGNTEKIKIITSQSTPSGANNTDILGSTHFALEIGSYFATNISITNARITAKTAKNIVTKDNLEVPGKITANGGLAIGGNDTFIVRRFTAPRQTVNYNSSNLTVVNINVPSGYSMIAPISATTTGCLCNIHSWNTTSVTLYVGNMWNDGYVLPAGEINVDVLLVRKAV